MRFDAGDCWHYDMIGVYVCKSCSSSGRMPSDINHNLDCPRSVEGQRRLQARLPKLICGKDQIWATPRGGE